MPRVTVKGFGDVNFPDSMDEAAISRAIESDILPQMQAQQASAPSSEPHVFMPPSNAWTRFGHGAWQTVNRVKQLAMDAGEATGLSEKGGADELTRKANQVESAYQNSRGKQANTFDPASAAGNAAMQAPLALLPGGGATMGVRTIAGALSGAASGALAYDPTNSLKKSAQNTGTGAVVGAVAAPVMGYIGDKAPGVWKAAIGRLKGLLADGKDPGSIAAAIPELAQMPPEAQRDLIAEAQGMIRKTGSLDAEALARKANLVANGLTPTTSMVTRDPATWTAERNLQKLAQSPDEALAKTGRQLTDVYQGNDRALTEKLGSMGSGLPKGDAEEQGMVVMKKLDELADASQKEVGKLYEQVRQAHGGDLASDAKNLASTLDNLKDNTYAEKLVSSVSNKLKRFGMMDKEGNLTTQTLTVDQAEELRKFVNTLPNDYGRRDIIKAIDTDVLSGGGADLFGGARSAASQRFAMLDNPTTQKALATWGELQQGKTAQSFIKSQVISAPAQDVKTLVDTLANLPGPKKDEAMNALKAGVLDHLQGKAVLSNGQFSGTGLDKALTAIGDDKLALVLGKDQLAQLKSLARAAKDATQEPAYAAVNHSNTAPMLMGLANKARYLQTAPVISHSIEVGKKLYTQNKAAGELADALAARAGGKMSIPPGSNDLAAALAAMGAPASSAVLNQRRQQP
jgi:hypothetical protein